MKKVKYYYNATLQQFEPLKVPLWKRITHVFVFLCATLVTAAIIVAIAFRTIQSPNEKRMNSEMNYLQEKYELLKKDMFLVRSKLTELEERDNHVYREIFEAEPISFAERQGTNAVEEKLLERKLKPFSNEELLHEMDKSMNEMKQRMQVQATSYDALQRFIEQKKAMLASIPSIQPVSNKQLERIASGFGARIDPIYKIMKFHAGLDFTAPSGTPIYATGNGTVELAEYHEGGFGNHVWIQHGFTYRSHYCHMLKIKAKKGQVVKRGEVIGWVGSTGKSTGPHCHYEVEKNGEKLDPIHFFYNDLHADDFERLVKIASRGNQSFD